MLKHLDTETMVGIFREIYPRNMAPFDTLIRDVKECGILPRENIIEFECNEDTYVFAVTAELYKKTIKLEEVEI